MQKEYVAMNLQCALLFAYFAAAEVLAQSRRWTPSFHWTEKMTIKNPDNSPYFNYPDLGSLQDAWKVLEQTSNNTYFLLFRTDASVYERCIFTSANITDKTNKTANYTIMSYDTRRKKYENVTLQVRALNQTDYPLENVIRANFNAGTLPKATPAPPGSYKFAQYDNSTCYSRSTPFPDRGNAGYGDYTGKILDELFPYPESADDFEMYVVYNEPQCYILRSPAAAGGCDLWLRKTELKKIVEDAGNQIKNKEKELTDKKKKELGIDENCTPTDFQKLQLEPYVEAGIGRWFQDIAWKQISLDCVLAYMITCGEPIFRVYNPITCNTTLTGQ
ncbi:uncharacterized protein LOC115316483 [Ixodes scapularis]|uniref:uncharacterized protein LOC115316483 n=1 Tax=Ixodes scapularis TaxID=6945 RepID=UPI001C38266D|nr:uncharacterized protein LOC115316483 [Ixodes scapularis]